MNLRLRKDIRLIAPTFVLMLLVQISFVSLKVTNDAEPPQFFAFLLLVLAVAGTVVSAQMFAREIQGGTVVWLLGLPMARRHVYLQKHLVLLGSLVVFWLAAMPSYMSVDRPPNTNLWTALVTLLLPFLALATGCYWSLVTRNVLYTIVLSLFVPFVLLLAISLPIDSLDRAETINLTEYQRVVIVISVLVAYGFLIAWRGWVRWERLEITGNAILHSPADLKFSQTFFSQIQRGKTGPFTALVVKEIGLQRFVLGLMTLNLVMIVLGVIFTGSPGGSVGKNYWALSFGIANNCFLFLTPVLCGAMALAEERQMKVFPWMTLLPVSMRKQWTVKLGVTLIISVIASLIVPLVGNFLRAEAGATAGLLDADLIPRMIQINLCLFAAAFIFSSMFDTSVKAAIGAAFTLFVAGLLISAVAATFKPLLLDMRTILGPEQRAYMPNMDLYLFSWPAILFGPALLAGLIFSYFNFRNHGVTTGRMLPQFVVFAALIVVGVFLAMLLEPVLNAAS